MDGDADSTSYALYDIIHDVEVTMPLGAVDEEMVEESWKLDSPLVKVSRFSVE